MKRLLIAALLSLGVMISQAAAQTAAVAQTTPPNVVFIITDDQRVEQSGNMPSLNSRIIQKGVRFTHAYSGNPLCCPARTSILRGQYSHYTRMYGVSGTYGGAIKMRVWQLQNESLPVWMDREGYRTGLVGKYLNGYSSGTALPHPTPPGWDFFRAWLTDDVGGEGGYQNFSVAEGGGGSALNTRSFTGLDSANYSTNVYTDYAVKFINSVPSTKPLFLSVNYHAPHAPYTPDPADATASCAVQHPMYPSTGEPDVSDKPQFIQNLGWTSGNRTAMRTRWTTRCRMMKSVDRGITRLVAALQTHDQGLENTVIIYTSDQGVQEGEHRLQSKKTAHEQSAGVPFYVRWDGVAPWATVSPRLVTHVDMTATAVAAASATVSNPIPCLSPCIQGPMEGVDLKPLLLNPAAPWRNDLLIEHYDLPTTPGYVPPYCAVVNDARMKYIRYDPDNELLNEELYDLTTDPHELTNKANDPAYAAVKATLLARLNTLCTPRPVDYGF